MMDVIVIGCGASGVAALRKLHDAGYKVLGLEAADRIGGRVCTVDVGGNHIDIGAIWCHGEKDNAVFELANPLGLLGKPSGPDNIWFVESNGEIIDNKTGGELIKVLDHEVAAADKKTKRGISETVRNITGNSTINKNPKLSKSFIEWYERNNHVGGQTNPRDGKSLRGSEEHGVCEGEFWMHWKGRGYKTLIDVLLNKYPDPSKAIPVQILLNKEVENIRWKSDSDSSNAIVHVKCKDGSLYTAKSVIITVSLGVLKERHNQLFSPALPIEKQKSIKNMQFCVLDKIYIEFTAPWWKFPANFSILWRDEDKAKFSDEDQWITEIYGMITIENHSNLLLAWIYGKGAEMMEKVSDEKLKEGVNKLLEMVFKKEFDVTPIKSIVRSQWASNPYTRGAYSYRSVASEEDGGSPVELSEPLCHGEFPVVCFGGEATSLHHQSQVHGAVEAGFREADRLIDSFKKLNK